LGSSQVSAQNAAKSSAALSLAFVFPPSSSAISTDCAGALCATPRLHKGFAFFLRAAENGTFHAWSRLGSSALSTTKTLCTLNGFFETPLFSPTDPRTISSYNAATMGLRQTSTILIGLSIAFNMKRTQLP